MLLKARLLQLLPSLHYLHVRDRQDATVRLYKPKQLSRRSEVRQQLRLLSPVSQAAGIHFTLKLCIDVPTITK